MASTGDEFEASNMHDGSPILHREKVVSRGLTAMIAVPGLMTIVLALYIAFANETAAKPVPTAALPFVVAAVAALGATIALMGLLFAVIRTIVTERAVHVKFGLWGPTIALEQIESCSVVDYKWTDFGGWGIRKGKNNTMAYVPSGDRVVEIKYTEDGKAKRVLIGVTDPDETTRQINRARTKTDQSLRVEETKTRVESESESESESEAAEETEAAKLQAK